MTPGYHQHDALRRDLRTVWGHSHRSHIATTTTHTSPQPPLTHRHNHHFTHRRERQPTLSGPMQCRRGDFAPVCGCPRHWADGARHTHPARCVAAVMDVPSIATLSQRHVTPLHLLLRQQATSGVSDSSARHVTRPATAFGQSALYRRLVITRAITLSARPSRPQTPHPHCWPAVPREGYSARDGVFIYLIRPT